MKKSASASLLLWSKSPWMTLTNVLCIIAFRLIWHYRNEKYTYLEEIIKDTGFRPDL